MSGVYLALLFLCIIVVFWGVSHLKKKDTSTNMLSHEDESECCGAHAVCEKESLLRFKIEIEYYDDEELDIFAGRSPVSYNEDEIRQFSDIFYTLQELDIAGWLKSLQSRNIELPENIKEEAFLIIRERRNLK